MNTNMMQQAILVAIGYQGQVKVRRVGSATIPQVTMRVETTGEAKRLLHMNQPGCYALY